MECLWKVGVFECEYATDAETEAGEVEEFACLFGTAGEAMEYSCESAAAILADESKEFVMGFAAMYHERQVVADCPLYLLFENSELEFAIGVVPVEIESYFAYGNEVRCGRVVD